MLETGTILNLVLMGLLLVALGFGVRLDKRLKALRASHEDFAKAVHELDEAAIRAHNSLKGLRADADDTQDLLHGRILAGRDLLQKLETHTKRAEKLAHELESAHVLNRNLLGRLEQLEKVQSTLAAPAMAETPIRQAFDRDMVRATAPKSPPESRPASVQRSRPADIIKDDLDADELVDKVHISELVVANLNEMIRNLAVPKPVTAMVKKSAEDDLFDAPL